MVCDQHNLQEQAWAEGEQLSSHGWSRLEYVDVQDAERRQCAEHSDQCAQQGPAPEGSARCVFRADGAGRKGNVGLLHTVLWLAYAYEPGRNGHQVWVRGKSEE